MPELRISPSWRERWRHSLQKLTPTQKFVLEGSLRELLEALASCKDPRRDRKLQRWRPTEWVTARTQSRQGEWIEYRLGDAENRARAIICFDAEEDVIYLVARTAIHDHDFLRKLVARFKPR